MSYPCIEKKYKNKVMTWLWSYPVIWITFQRREQGCVIEHWQNREKLSRLHLEKKRPLTPAKFKISPGFTVIKRKRGLLSPVLKRWGIFGMSYRISAKQKRWWVPKIVCTSWTPSVLASRGGGGGQTWQKISWSSVTNLNVDFCGAYLHTGGGDCSSCCSHNLSQKGTGTWD